MNKRLEREVRAWLEAERLSADELAEQSLVRAFVELGRREPQGAFADRVLLRAGRFAPAVTGWHARWIRAAVAAAILVVGLAAITLPTWWLLADPLARSIGLPLAASLSHGLARAAAAWVAAWTLISGIGSALRAALVTPTAVALLIVNFLLAAASLLGLKQLLTPGEAPLGPPSIG